MTPSQTGNSRVPSIPPSLNFRALDGIATRHGARLAPGLLHRSGELCQLAPWQADAFARAIALRTVIDLRTTFELEERGTGALLPPWRHVHVPFFEEVLPHWADAPDQTPNATAVRYLEMLEHGGDALVRVVAVLAGADTLPAMIHCAAGRDRTGIAVACLLDVLDVPDELIAADYARSEGTINDGGRADPETLFVFLRAVRDK